MSGETTGAVRILLRLEGLCVLAAASTAYAEFGFSWATFALYFLLPDLALFAYFAGAKAGAVCYNTTHSYVGAMICLTLGFIAGFPGFQCAGLIWCAHIGFDRALGYGLKYPEGFGFTHLGPIGRFAAKPTETMQ
jgi:hypothetical protein